MRVLHVSDVHFGRPAVPEQFEAIEATIAEERYDVVAISGDLSQRARTGEFLRARAFLRDAQRVSRTVVVPGNHDVAWWRAPLKVGDHRKVYEAYRAYIDQDLEPVLRMPGATFVGLNTAHGVTGKTLTWNLRDVSVIGYLTRRQIERAAEAFAETPERDARVIVMHHNPVKGELSQRHGLKNTRRVLGAFAELGVDIVLCGHDHQEAIHFVEHTRKGTIVSTAGTVSNRSRGGRPSSYNVIEVAAHEIRVTPHIWAREARRFVGGEMRCFDR
jgi:3',5'-cyclic AMP phosphodiesterase CpdA